MMVNILGGSMVDGKYVPNFNGKKGSPFGIKPEDLNDQVWDFIMLNGPPPQNCKIPKVELPNRIGPYKYTFRIH